MDWIKLDSNKLENGIYFVALKNGKVGLSNFVKKGTVDKSWCGREFVVEENIWIPAGFIGSEYNYEESDILYVMPYPIHPDKK